MTLDLTATYDPSTPIGQVRLLIFDVDVASNAPLDVGEDARADWSCFFVDVEIQSILNNYPFNPIPYAGADLLDSMANNAAVLAKLFRIGGFEQDTRGISRELGQRAEKIRTRADSIPFEMITDYPWTDANWGRMILQPRGVFTP